MRLPHAHSSLLLPKRTLIYLLASVCIPSKPALVSDDPAPDFPGFLRQLSTHMTWGWPLGPPEALLLFLQKGRVHSLALPSLPFLPLPRMQR